MAEITAEGHMSTTTTIIDGKNGSVPSSSMKVGKKSVTEDLVTTFSSPAAWILVVALIVTWSAVAIVVFDLVDYKNLAATYSEHCDDPCLPPGKSVNKLSTEPLRIIHETLEESTDWLYGFISFLSDIVWSDDDDDSDEGEVESSLKKEIHKPKPEKHEKRAPLKVIHRDKPEKQAKTERKEPLKVSQKDKLERQEKPEKKERHAAVHKEKPEKPEKYEKKAPAKEEKKVKSGKVEAKVKKEVKDGKEEAKMTEKIKQAETKTTEVGLIKAKPKVKEEKALQTVTKSEKKDQYAFCRYVIDMFAQGDFYPGGGHKEMIPPRLLLEHSPRKKPEAIEEEKSIVVAREVKKRNEEKKRTDIKRASTGIKKKEKEGKKEKTDEKTAVSEIKKADKKEAVVSKEVKNPEKTPAAKPAAKKAVAPELHKREKMIQSAKTAKKEVKIHASMETLKSKAVPEKKEEKARKGAEQDKPKTKQGNPGKEKELKSPAAAKNKEHAKEEGKNPTSSKDKDSMKGKNPKNPEGSKEKETGKRKDVKPPASLKEKDSSKGKEIKTSDTTKEKAAVKKEGDKKATSEKPHKNKNERVKHEKAVSQTKPEEKIKQQRTTHTEKSEHEAVRHEKDVPPAKSVKLKTTAKPVYEIPTAAMKKTKTAKEKEEKTIEKKHMKDEKSKGVPPVKEAPRHHNLTSAPVRYFQCVFLNGPNGFGLQFPTNPPSDKEETSHTKTSKRKTRKPGQ
ncbi:triadin isoform X12 [Apus apus]|uniref:triadin isoform X12 n=1 Tax=Apus apus TaxID=8895 RepID=UPI0021F835BD|nr:triadin isoform X12 [Apus apus]